MGFFDRLKKKKTAVEEPKKEEVKAQEVVEEKEPEEEVEITPVEEVEVVKVEKVEEPKVEEVEVEEKKETPAPKKAKREKKEYGTYGIIGEDGKKYYPERTFMDRLCEADDDLLKMYSDLKNLFLSYKKVHTRISKTNDAFRFEGNLIGKIIVAGNNLKVYLALDPTEVDSAIYHQRDASGKKHFAQTPLVVKVKSPLSYRKAKVLIAMACEKQTVKKQRFKPKDWTNPETKEDLDEE